MENEEQLLLALFQDFLNALKKPGLDWYDSVWERWRIERRNNVEENVSEHKDSTRILTAAEEQTDSYDHPSN